MSLIFNESGLKGNVIVNICLRTTAQSQRGFMRRCFATGLVHELHAILRTLFRRFMSSRQKKKSFATDRLTRPTIFVLKQEINICRHYLIAYHKANVLLYY